MRPVPRRVAALLNGLLVSSAAALALAGCGGGGGGIGLAVLTLGGTAAFGGPIPTATVTIQDTAGNAVTTTTDADGNFSANVAGLTPPYVLMVESGGRKIYSVAFEAGTANIHPLSDLVVRTCYDAYGQSVDTLFANPSPTDPVPTEAAVAALNDVVKGLIGPSLLRKGLPAEGFDGITTPFSADHTGFDAVLDVTVVTPTASYLVTTDDGVTTQTARVAVDDATDTLTVTSTAVAAGATTTAYMESDLPLSATLAAAVDGVNAMLAEIAAVANAHAAAKDLSYAHLEPYFSAQYKRGAWDQQSWAGSTSQALRGHDTQAFYVKRVLRYDDASKVLDGLWCWVVDGEAWIGPESFTLEGGGWKVYGNQQPFFGFWSPLLHTSTEYTAAGVTTTYAIDPFTYFAPGEVTAATMTALGTALVNAVLDIQRSVTSTYEIAPGQMLDITEDRVGVPSASLGSPPWTVAFDDLPPAGTVCEFTFTTASGTLTVRETIAAKTSEAVVVAGPAGHALADAKLDQPLTFSWDLPRTFLFGYAIVGVTYGTTNDETYTWATKATAVGGLPPTSATITIPSTYKSQPVTHAMLNVDVYGQSGEYTTAQWRFGP